MSYLKMIQDKIQKLTEDISSALNIDVTVVDENLIRIGGTGYFYDNIDKSSPHGSIFEKILHSGNSEVNIKTLKSDACRNCSIFVECQEKGNMAYPIKVEGKVIGVISFAAFDDKQGELMESRCQEYFKVLQQFSSMIEKEIVNIKITNRLNREMAEVNEIINSVGKGILIINSNNQITHINQKALRILGINLSTEKIILKNVSSIIKNLNVRDTGSRELIDTWEVGRTYVKVLYEINELVLDNKKISTLVAFNELREIINIAFSYTNDNSFSFSNIIGNSPKLIKVIERAKIAAKSDSTILLQGESGTGKELFARSIHNASPRKDEPFVAINCASIPENLIESELFGYEKGAFTGASPSGKIGKFELASNGTLFLDEIGDLPMHLQPKLLRVLQQKEIIRVGGNKPVKVNVRIIAATHNDLEDSVRNKTFRQDLFYRLNVIPLKLPPLRERESDVFICSEHILNKLAHIMGSNEKVLSRQVEQKFAQYGWKGNIRELENVLEYAATFSTGREITLDDLPEYFHAVQIENSAGEIDMDSSSLEDLVNQFERTVLNKYIQIYGDTTEAKKQIAAKLGISLTTLYRKLNECGL